MGKFDISQKAVWRQSIRQKYGIEEDAFVYGFVGRITRDKGNNELFAAYRKLLEKNPTSYLLLVGRLEKTETLDPELFAWAQNEPHVVFCEYTGNEETCVTERLQTIIKKRFGCPATGKASVVQWWKRRQWVCL